MLPAIAAGASWLFDLIGPLLAWEAASSVAGKLGTRLAGAGAKEIAEAAAKKVGASAIGGMAEKALAPVAGAVPKAVGKYLTAEELTKQAVQRTAGLGSMIAGSMGAAGLTSLLAGRNSMQHHDEIAAMPNGEALRQAMNMDNLMRQGDMREALAQYLGDREAANDIVNAQPRRIV